MPDFFKRFDVRIEAVEPHVLLTLAEIDAAKGAFRHDLRMAPQYVETLRRSTIVTSTGASTRIEGSTLSDEDVARVMKGLSISRFEDRDSQEVQGYLETLQNVFAAYDRLPVRESVIMSLHNELMKYSSKDGTHRGAYKRQENLVGVLGPHGEVQHVVFATTPAYLTPKEMHELVDWTADALERRRFHPLLVIGNFLVEFLKIHPFVDGNGRLSRVLTNLLLLRSGYLFAQYVSHEQLIERRKDEYYFALRAAQETLHTETPNAKPWLNFFLSVMREQSVAALALIDNERIDGSLSEKQQAVWQTLMERIAQSPAEIAAHSGVGMPTVRQALDKLMALGRVKREGAGRATRYRKT